MDGVDSQKRGMSGLCTVVIAAFNAERFLGQALASVAAQRGVAVELVVVDDGSTDDTAGVARRFAGAPLRLLQQANRGVSAARNAGLAAAQGEFVLFLDADDWLLEGALARLVEALQAAPDTVAAYGEAVRATEEGVLKGADWGPLFAPRPSGQVLRELLQYNFILTGTICARTEVVRAAGGFAGHLRLCEDWALWCTLAAEGPLVYVVPPAVSAYRETAGSACDRLGSSLAETEAAIAHVFAMPAVQAQAGADLARLRQRRVAQAHSFVGTRAYRQGSWREARVQFSQSARLSPTTARTWLLLALSLVRLRPQWVERRLK
jgi:hypothetical protein